MSTRMESVVVITGTVNNIWVSRGSRIFSCSEMLYKGTKYSTAYYCSSDGPDDLFSYFSGWGPMKC